MATASTKIIQATPTSHQKSVLSFFQKAPTTTTTTTTKKIVVDERKEIISLCSDSSKDDSEVQQSDMVILIEPEPERVSEVVVSDFIPSESEAVGRLNSDLVSGSVAEVISIDDNFAAAGNLKKRVAKTPSRPPAPKKAKSESSTAIVELVSDAIDGDVQLTTPSKSTPRKKRQPDSTASLDTNHEKDPSIAMTTPAKTKAPKKAKTIKDGEKPANVEINVSESPIGTDATFTPDANAEQSDKEAIPIALAGKKKRPQRAKVSSLKVSEMEEAPAVEKSELKQPEPLPNEAQLIVDCSNDRVKSLMADLLSFEGFADLCDLDLGVDNLECDFLGFINGVAATESGEGIAPDQANPSADSVDAALQLVRGALARHIQGQKLPLQEIIAKVRVALLALRNAIDENTNDDQSASSVEGDSPGSARRELLFAMLDRLTDSNSTIILGEEVKTIATREAYGNRTSKVTLPFEDSDQMCIWRWEVISMGFFDNDAQAIIREARRIRGLFGRAVKATEKVIEQVLKTPTDSEKLSPLQERAAKCVAEVEKLREKRRENERKRLADAEQKRLKELAKEQKRKEKEELEEKKVLEKKAEKPPKPVSEKDVKKAESLEKQKNLFMSFLKPKTETTTATSSSAVASMSPHRLGPLVKLTSASPDDTHNPGSKRSSNAIAKETLCGGFDEAAFEASLKAGLSMGELFRGFREKNRFSEKPKKSRRKPVKITVTITANNANEFGTETYSDIRDVLVDNKMRTFSFNEDLRPAYVGTFSKTSKVLNGRNPFSQDHQHLNYDYDSEAEWEEEADGEDIANSEDEDDGEADDLEYDDFFLRDNDFGSDADSDGEEMAAVTMRKREGEECVGPRFVRSNFVHEGSKQAIIDTRQGYRVEQGNALKCDDKEKDIVRLSCYSAVFFASDLIPTLTTSPDQSPDDKMKKKTKTAKSAEGLDSSSPVTDKEVKDAEDKKALSKGLDDGGLCALIRFLHGKKDGLDKVVISFCSEYPSFAQSVSKNYLRTKIMEIADKQKHAEGFGTVRWICKPEYLNILEAAEGRKIDPVEYTPVKAKKVLKAKSAVDSTTTVAVPAPSPIPNPFFKKLSSADTERSDGEACNVMDLTATLTSTDVDM